MLVHACMRARAAAGGGRPAGAGAGSGSGMGMGSGSYPAWFFLNQVSRVWTTSDPNQTRSAIRI